MVLGDIAAVLIVVFRLALPKRLLLFPILFGILRELIDELLAFFNVDFYEISPYLILVFYVING